MSQDDYTPPDQRHSGFDSAGQAKFSTKALGDLLERITPWLFEVGSWIFGGLVAFNLVLVSALLTVGPVDRAILISITAFACALPLKHCRNLFAKTDQGPEGNRNRESGNAGIPGCRLA
jgi:hypothetical protein